METLNAAQAAQSLSARKREREQLQEKLRGSTTQPEVCEGDFPKCNDTWQALLNIT